MADNWQSIGDLSEALALTDTVLVRNISNTTANAAGTTEEAEIQAIANALAAIYAPINNATFTGTVTIPDGALAIADTSGLQTALDGKQPLDADLTTLATAFTSASGAGPASLALAEDTDSGSMRVVLTAPAVIATADKAVTFQDVAGTVYVTGGTDVAVADGGTGVSTLGSGNVLLGAGTSPVTSAKAAPAGDFVGTTDTQTLSGKTVNNIILTGTVTVPDAALAIADTSGLQAALDAKQPLDADLTTLATAFVSASAAGPASLKLAEDTDAGTTGVILTGPAASAGDKVVSYQDVAGTVYVSTGTDVPVTDGGTGVSTLGSGNVLLGAGTSPVTSAKAAPSGDFVGTTDTQTLSGKTINNVVLTGTVTVPDAALAIADTSGLQTALDAKLALAGGTMSGAVIFADQVLSRPELKDYSETIATQTGVTGALAIDYTSAPVHHITHGAGNISGTTISNWPATGKFGSVVVQFKQDGTGGRTLVHPTGVVHVNGAPTFDTALNKTNVMVYTTRDNGTTVEAYYSGVY